MSQNELEIEESFSSNCLNESNDSPKVPVSYSYRSLYSIENIVENTKKKKIIFVSVVLIAFFLSTTLFVFLDKDDNSIVDESYDNINEDSDHSTNFNYSTTDRTYEVSSIKTVSEQFINVGDSTTQTNYVETDTMTNEDKELIVYTKAYYTEECLKNATNGYSYRESYEEAYDDVHCNKKVNVTINKKTVVRLIMFDSMFFSCKWYGPGRCSYFFREEIRNHRSEYELWNIYFNFVINVNGSLYKGVSLYCNFNKGFLNEDRNEIISIGIPKCEPYFLSNRHFSKTNFSITLKELLDCSSKNQILSDNYSIQLHDNCKYLLLDESLFSNHSILYEKNNLLDFKFYKH